MNYYEVEFKLKIVKEYLEGPLGGRALAKKYSLSSNATHSFTIGYRLINCLVKKDLKRTVHQQNILVILSEMSYTL
jgi:hypothetical protein